MLGDDRGAATPIDAFDRMPYDPGLYIVYSDIHLPRLEWDSLTGPLYVGKADDGRGADSRKSMVVIPDGRP